MAARVNGRARDMRDVVCIESTSVFDGSLRSARVAPVNRFR